MLRQQTAAPPETARCEIRVFVKVRNEALRLPHFLSYYRRLGADRFVIVDNASTDGTPALLAAQSDVHLFSTDASFSAAGGGQRWLNTLLERYGSGHWCLTVDADELLCTPGIERMGLRGLCDALDREGAEGLPCMMLDMYGAGPVGAPGYVSGEPFLLSCPWFDPGPYRRVALAAACPWVEIYGGVRQRVFYPRWQEPDIALRLSERLYNLGGHLAAFRDSPVIQSWRVKPPPNLAKVPLIRWRDGLRYLAVTHQVSPVRLSAGSGCLLHFKFLVDFAEKVAVEVTRGAYFDDAREYRRYASVLEQQAALTLWHEISIRFEDSLQLGALGLAMPVPDVAQAAREMADA